MPQNPIYSPFYGMDPVALQSLLAQAQQALIDIQLGGKPVSLSYTQGDGSRSVTYQPSSKADLLSLINELKLVLNLPVQRRAPLRGYFG